MKSMTKKEFLEVLKTATSCIVTIKCPSKTCSACLLHTNNGCLAHITDNIYWADHEYYDYLIKKVTKLRNTEKITQDFIKRSIISYNKSLNK